MKSKSKTNQISMLRDNKYSSSVVVENCDASSLREQMSVSSNLVGKDTKFESFVCSVNSFIDGDSVKIMKFIRNLKGIPYNVQRAFWLRICKMSVHVQKRICEIISNRLIHICIRDEASLFKRNFNHFANLFDAKTRMMFKSQAFNLEAQSLFGVDLNLKLSDDFSNKLFEILPNVLPQLKELGNIWLGRIVRFILMIFECSSDSQLSSKMRSIAAFLVDFTLDNVESITQTLVYVFQRLLKKVGLEAEDGLNCGENLLGSLTSLFVSILGEKNFRDMQMDNMRIKRLDGIMRLIKTSKDVIMFLYSVLSEWIDQLTESVFGFNFSNKYLSVLNNEIPIWMERVSYIYNNGGLIESSRDFVLAKEILDLKRRGDDFFVVLQRVKNLPHNIFSFFLNIYNQCKEMAKNALALSYNDKTRVSPFVLYIYGKTGIGKSTTQDFLMKDLFLHMDIPFDYTRDVYVRNSMQDHWDGYIGQKVVVFDDFLQNRDEEVMRGECNELIHMKNTTSYPLKMASLEDKGTTRFTSDLVLISSNTDFTRELSYLVTEPNAVRRRRDVVVELILKEKYKMIDGRLDVTTINEEFPFDPFIYNFVIRNTYSGEILLTLGYLEFIQFCSQKWKLTILQDRRLLDAIPTWDVRSLSAQSWFNSNETFTKETWLTEINLFIESVKKNCSTLMWYKIGSLVLGALGLFGLSWLFRSDLKNETEANISGDYRTQKNLRRVVESNISGDLRTTKQVRRVVESNISGDVRTNKYKRFIQESEAQMSRDPQAHDIISNKILNNLVHVDNDNKGTKGLFLCETFLLLPCHFVNHLVGEEIIIHAKTQVYSIKLEECERFDDESKDISILRTPRTYGQYASILQHFHEEKHIGQIRFDIGVIPTLKGISNLPYILSVENIKRIGKTEYILRNNEGNIVDTCLIIEGFEYRAQTHKGDCGSPLILLNSSVQRKILGIHVAGALDTGVSNILSQEYLKNKLLLFDDVVIQEEFLDCDDELTAQCCGFFDNCEFLGKVANNRGFRNPGKTEILESPLHNMYEPLTAPALLRPLGDINPLFNAIKDQFVSNIVFPEELVKLACDDIKNLLGSLNKITNYAYVLSDNEMINGVKGDNWIRPLDLLTSPGFPFIFSKSKNLKGKHSFFKGEDGNKEMTSFLQERVRDRELNLFQGIALPAIFCDTLKDERRELEKVRLGKTRVFNTGPVDFNLLVRKYFSGFCAHLMNNHLQSECCVGVNPHNGEWKQLYNRLDKKNGLWFGGDFSKYDKQLSYQLLEASLDIIQDFYKDDFYLVRKGLWVSMFNAYHLCGKNVYRCRQGNPSGIPITVIINSLVNMILMRISFLGICNDLSLIDFNNKVSIATYGDDNLICCDSSLRNYNMRSVGEWFGKFGVKYTSPDKNDINKEFLEREEITFLKRKFVKFKSEIYAPLPLNIIKEMMLWMRGDLDVDYAMSATWNSVLTELTHYPEVIYDEITQHILNFATKKGVRLSPKSYTLALRERICLN
nr:MAG: RNA-dependent RNA polymerase [Avian associated picorna-like virus 20]